MVCLSAQAPVMIHGLCAQAPVIVHGLCAQAPVIPRRALLAAVNSTDPKAPMCALASAISSWGDLGTGSLCPTAE